METKQNALQQTRGIERIVDGSGVAEKAYPTSSGFLNVGNCLGHCDTDYYGRRMSDDRLEKYDPTRRNVYSKILGRRAEEGWAIGISTFNGNGLVSIAENPAWGEYVNSDMAMKERRRVKGGKCITTNPELIRAAKIMGRVSNYNPYIFEYFRATYTPTERYVGAIEPIVIPKLFKDNNGREFVIYELPKDVKFQPHNSFDNIKSQRGRN